MKTVLVPTDFQVESLKIIDSLVRTGQPDQLVIVFMHAFKLSDSITDMLMLNRRSRDYNHVSDEFYSQIEIYKKKYPEAIKFIGIEYFYGSTVAAFRNFIERINADCIAYAKSADFRAINKFSIDPALLIKRCGCAVLELDTEVFAKEEKLFDTKMPDERRRVLSA